MKHLNLWVVILIALPVLLSSVAWGQDKKEAFIQGLVTVKYDANKNIASVTIKDDSIRPARVYSVTLDAKGQRLGHVMEDTRADVKGRVRKVGKTSWITVTSYKVTEKKPEPPKIATPPEDSVDQKPVEEW